jgi:hypothetical protein
MRDHRKTSLVHVSNASQAIQEMESLYSPISVVKSSIYVSNIQSFIPDVDELVSYPPGLGRQGGTHRGSISLALVKPIAAVECIAVSYRSLMLPTTDTDELESNAL